MSHFLAVLVLQRQTSIICCKHTSVTVMSNAIPFDRTAWLGSLGTLFSWVTLDRTLATAAAALTVLYMFYKVVELKRKLIGTNESGHRWRRKLCRRRHDYGARLLRPGFVADAENCRFRTGKIETRKGVSYNRAYCSKGAEFSWSWPVDSNAFARFTVNGIGLFMDPNGDDAVLLFGPSHGYILFEDRELKFTHGMEESFNGHRSDSS